jgi:hypothetical protein
MPGYDDPATPDQFDRVGVLKVGPPDATKVLVLEPGTNAGAGYFLPMARDLVNRTNGEWQVWSVERRENLLEDQSRFDEAKAGRLSAQSLFDYYFGWLNNPAITTHLHPVADADVPFARGWGMNVAVRDLRVVVQAAREGGRRHVVLGGHSLGARVATAYATWDFNGRAGARDLRGLVFVDGGSDPNPLSADDAAQQLASLRSSSPWTGFPPDVPAPLVAIDFELAAEIARLDPHSPSILQRWPLLASHQLAPVPVTNEAHFGFTVDTETITPVLLLVAVDAGHLAAAGDPRGWDRAGERTPLDRYEDMLAGPRLPGVDGTEWYQPIRMIIDGDAVAEGNANPAQAVLDVDAIHGDRVDLPMYAFAAAVGGPAVIEQTKTLAAQSHVPSCALRLVDRSATWAHNDPAGASPDNEFLDGLAGFLDQLPHLADCGRHERP